MDELRAKALGAFTKEKIKYFKHHGVWPNYAMVDRVYYYAMFEYFDPVEFGMNVKMINTFKRTIYVGRTVK